MKKLNSHKAAVLAALFGTVGLIQACGHSSSSPGAAPISTGIIGNVGNGGNGTTLYGACQNIQNAQNQLGGLQITGAVQTTASDGASVCKVNLLASGVYQGSRSYLGPNAPQAAPLNTGLLLQPYDQTQVAVNGTYTTGVFGGCGSNTVNGLMYGYVAGLNEFLVGSALPEVPANGGGYLEIGLNQTQGTGQMCIQLQATILRCVDASGNSHPC